LGKGVAGNGLSLLANHERRKAKGERRLKDGKRRTPRKYSEQRREGGGFVRVSGGWRRMPCNAESWRRYIEGHVSGPGQRAQLSSQATEPQGAKSSPFCR
jgi:hypothetical protein